MTNLPRYAIILALSLGCAGWPSSINSQTKAPGKAPVSSVSGHVSIHGKSAPGIVVGLSLVEMRAQQTPALKATTDQDGNYRIKDVPPGNYHVSPVAPVYVSPEPFSFRDQVKLLMLAENEDVTGIDFSLLRGAVITGKVTDADGRPVVEERLTIVPAAQVNQLNPRYPAIGAGGFLTDDRGIYRVYGVPPGHYKIFVGQGGENAYASSGTMRVSYRQTFYPDAVDQKDAKVVEVTEGSEAADIDIRLGPTLPSFAASGRVVDGETGQAVPGLRMALSRPIKDGFAYSSTSAPSNSQGEFRLEHVPPGKYAVWILPMQGTETLADGVQFEVVDQDVTGLLVKTSKGASISGNLVVDGKNDQSILAKIGQLRLSAYVRSDNTGAPAYARPAVVNADGSFRLTGLGAGSANFSLGSRDRQPLANFLILRVERDGVVQPRGVEIKDGEQLTGVKIVLSYGTGAIRGVVKLVNGPLPEGGRLMSWTTKVSETEGSFRRYEVDERGHFLIEGLAAGDYILQVQAWLPGRHPPPSSEQPITVTEGRVTEVSVSLDLTMNPGPVRSP